ncbi:hypothetical protein [Acidipila sp. EB88]|nr:hypothetical protein [Acidipila sp. EB88]
METDFDTLPRESTNAAGIPKSTVIPLITLVSISLAALTAVIIILGREK